MKLNCKPGDLAVIVQGLTTHSNIGKVVTVLGPALQPGCWIVHCDHPLKTIFGGLDGIRSESTVGPIEDYRLRPIRDPGNDAVDESSAWLPPVPRTVPADASQAKKTTGALVQTPATEPDIVSSVCLTLSLRAKNWWQSLRADPNRHSMSNSETGQHRGEAR